MLIRETFVNKDKNAIFGESDWYEPATDDVAKLFKALQREYGRCVSSIYVDQRAGPPIRTGWVFAKVMTYEDCNDTYTREVWVQLADKVETHGPTVTPHVLASR